MSRKSRNRPAYFTTAKWNSGCAETGEVISMGEPIAYFPAERKVYAITTKQAQTLADELGVDLTALVKPVVKPVGVAAKRAAKVPSPVKNVSTKGVEPVVATRNFVELLAAFQGKQAAAQAAQA